MTAVVAASSEPEPDGGSGANSAGSSSIPLRGLDVSADDEFEAWLRDNRSSLLRVAKAVCRDRALAEDAVQDACLKMWLLPREEIRGMLAFARTVTHHAAVDLLRRRRDSPRGDAALEVAAARWTASLPEDPEIFAGAALAWRNVREVVGDRDVAILFLTGLGYTDADICSLLALPAEKGPQIKMMRARARAKLRDRGMWL